MPAWRRWRALVGSERWKQMCSQWTERLGAGKPARLPKRATAVVSMYFPDNKTSNVPFVLQHNLPVHLVTYSQKEREENPRRYIALLLCPSLLGNLYKRRTAYVPSQGSTVCTSCYYCIRIYLPSQHGCCFFALYFVVFPSLFPSLLFGLLFDA